MEKYEPTSNSKLPYISQLQAKQIQNFLMRSDVIITIFSLV
jgi:hypothetical protein